MMETKVLNLTPEEAKKKIISGESFAGNVVIKGSLNFTGKPIAGDFNVEGITIEGDMNLRGVAIDGSVNLNRATIRGSLDIKGIFIRGDLILREASITGRMDIREADIGGFLAFSKLKLTEILVDEKQAQLIHWAAPNIPLVVVNDKNTNWLLNH